MAGGLDDRPDQDADAHDRGDHPDGIEPPRVGVAGDDLGGDVGDPDAQALADVLLDGGLDEMASAFRMSPWTRLRHVVIPQLAPYFAAAARSGLSLVWKIVLVVELLGRPNGVGFEIGTAFQLFDVRLLLAYALPFVALMLAIETFAVQPFERRASYWRLNAA